MFIANIEQYRVDKYKLCTICVRQTHRVITRQQSLSHTYDQIFASRFFIISQRSDEQKYYVAKWRYIPAICTYRTNIVGQT